MKKRIKLAGQVQHKSMKAALDHVSELMGKLHVETTEKIKQQRMRRR